MSLREHERASPPEWTVTMLKDASLPSRRYYSILIVAWFVSAVSGCAGYAPGRQSYWGSQIRELCAKDGGITVYESIELTREEYERLGGLKQGLPIPDARTVKAGFPYIREEIRTIIREANPRVMRGETLIKRRSDSKVLGRSVRYWRSGGDLPTGLAEQTYFICPEQSDLSLAVFRVISPAK